MTIVLISRISGFLISMSEQPHTFKLVFPIPHCLHSLMLAVNISFYTECHFRLRSHLCRFEVACVYGQ